MNGTTIMVTTPCLLDQARREIRLKHYRIRTEQAYLDWIKRFICHFCKRHPNEMGAREVGHSRHGLPLQEGWRLRRKIRRRACRCFFTAITGTGAAKWKKLISSPALIRV